MYAQRLKSGVLCLVLGGILLLGALYILEDVPGLPYPQQGSPWSPEASLFISLLRVAAVLLVAPLGYSMLGLAVGLVHTVLLALTRRKRNDENWLLAVYVLIEIAVSIGAIGFGIYLVTLTSGFINSVINLCMASLCVWLYFVFLLAGAGKGPLEDPLEDLWYNLFGY